jgi:hypothetical protein
MSAEQAWDSCATLVVGPRVDAYKAHRGEQYAKAMKIDLDGDTAAIKAQIENAAGAARPFGSKAAAAPKAGPRKKRLMARAAASADADEVDPTAPPVRDGLVLARASELPQPERDEHFLRMFGQSDRQIADSSSDEGSIPQVLMLMNGDAQRVIHAADSLAMKTAAGQPTPAQQVESLYLSFFSRKPRPDELGKALAGLNDGLTLADLTWVLFNSREFVFVE